MPADYTVKVGDTAPAFIQVLSFEDGTVVDLTGASYTMTMRSLTSAKVQTITGTVTSPNPSGGYIQYQPTANDTATPGNYQANWTVTFPDSSVETFPSDGYNWIQIQPSLTAIPQALVALDDVKEYLNITATSRERDEKLLRYISAVTPLIEAITGPIIPKIYEEWHDGGANILELLRKPATGFGTSPVMNLIAASEYRGPIEYPLALVASPVFGSIYSLFLNSDMGTVTRRTAGGMTIAFMPGRESIHIWYQAGQAVTPPNVYEATLELIRVNYQTTQQTGAGARTVADTLDTGGGGGGPAMGFFLPRRVRDLLEPTRRAPSFA